MEWRFIDSANCDAAFNMALDEAIAISVRSGDAPPTLRFYGWATPSVSLGSFQKITDIDIEYCMKNYIPVVRRPTGGRAILHGDELTYSFSSRNEGDFSNGLLGSYRKLSIAFKYAMEQLGLAVSLKEKSESARNLTRNPICFKSTSYGEISIKGKKIIGSAQKRWNDAFLQQGSIPYSIDYEKNAGVFKVEKDILKEMFGLGQIINDFDPDRFKNAIISSFEVLFNVKLVSSPPLARELEVAHLLLQEKYKNPIWTQASKLSRFYNSSGMLKKAL